MGTVGLSFGSPTSGAGFDVSTTVASIVANLKNVETPWNTQLTALKSQDTAISSLGTLFSNLSNDMSSLTDPQGIMALKTGSSSNTNALTLTAATAEAIAGTHTVAVANLATSSSGYLAAISNSSDTLTGAITLQVGSGAAQTITLTSSDNSLAGLAKAINASGVGITASVLTDSSGSRLSMVSGTSGGNGNIVVSANSISAYVNYTGSAGTVSTPSTGSLAALAHSTDTLTGSVSIQVGSGTAENIVFGVAPATPAANTIYTGNSVDTLATLASTIGINAATLGVTATVAGSTLSLTSSTPGTAGTLTVNSQILDASTSLLGYTNPVVGVDAKLTVDGVDLTSASNTVAGLIPGVTFQLLAPSSLQSDGSLQQIQVVIGNDNTGVESTFNTMVSDYNSIISAMNTQEGLDTSGNAEPLFGSPTLSLLQQQILGGLNIQNPNGNLDSIATNTNSTLAGSINITVGSGAVQTVSMPSSGGTLSSLATAINSANIGVTATVVTTGNRSSLSLFSQTAGSNGALSISSSIVASSDTVMSYSGTSGTDTVNSTGTLTGIPSAGDTLSGSLTIEAGTGATTEFDLSSLTDKTLTGLSNAINNAGIGITASVVTANGLSSLSLVSQTAGTAGNLTVASALLDTTSTSSTTLNYTNSSDLSSLGNLGISVNNDGTITFDAATLDSVLNTDYSSAVGFFQNPSSWGQTFAATLSNSGSTSTSGILALAAKSNSGIESTLNADISKEELMISAQSKSLTAELNSANEIMQMLPTELTGVNELYSAITGYNQNPNG
jgi:flagellar hook-associated protein 2